MLLFCEDYSCKKKEKEKVFPDIVSWKRDVCLSASRSRVDSFARKRHCTSLTPFWAVLSAHFPYDSKLFLVSPVVYLTFVNRVRLFIMWKSLKIKTDQF